jgi:hypothetical protein
MKWSVMNVRERVIGGGIISAGIVAFMTLYITPCLALEVYEVKLNPQGARMTASVNPGKKCEKNPHEGCMWFQKNDLGVITFYVGGTVPIMRNCVQAASKNHNNHKVITKVELTATGTGNADQSKGVYISDPATDPATDPDVPGWLKSDAFTELNLKTGVVYSADTDKANNRLTLINLNNSDYVSGQFKSFWYKVTVTSCDGSKTWVTDPRGDNEGRNED